jgi:hypothetical protein
MDAAFLECLKTTTERRWKDATIDRHVYGFQLTVGTRWLPGLEKREIDAYEDALGVRFPNALRTFLAHMNGTDLPTINVYGSSGEPHRAGVGFYSFPRDVDHVKERMARWRAEWLEIRDVLAEQGTVIGETDVCVPIYGHRGVLCTSDPESDVVLSIMETDAIVYGPTLHDYLEQLLRGGG